MVIVYNNYYMIWRGILYILSFLCCIYIIRKIIKKNKVIKRLYQTKKQLMKGIITIDSIYEIQEKNRYIERLIQDIQNDIATIKEQTAIQSIWGGNEREKIEEEIRIFHEKINNHKKYIDIQQNDENSINNQKERILHREQIRIMNKNIQKFLLVYKEKEKTIEEKNKIIETFHHKIIYIEDAIREVHTNKEEEKLTILQQKIDDINRRIDKEESKIRKTIILFLGITTVLIWWYFYIRKYVIYIDKNYQNIVESIAVNSSLQVSKLGFSNRFLKP